MFEDIRSNIWRFFSSTEVVMDDRERFSERIHQQIRRDNDGYTMIPTSALDIHYVRGVDDLAVMHPSKPPPALPIEVIENILDLMTPRPCVMLTLVHCACVCQAWYYKSIACLYREVIISSNEQLIKFGRAFQGDTLVRLARPQVQCVHIVAETRTSDTAPTWALGYGPILGSYCPNLPELRLFWVSFENAPGAFSIAVASYPMLRHLTSLHLGSVRFYNYLQLMRFITSFPALQTLRMDSIEIEQSRRPDFESTTLSFQGRMLRTLTINYCPSSVYAIFAALPRWTTQSLLIADYLLRDESITVFQDMIIKFSETLQFLDATKLPPPLVGSITATSWPVLRHLSLPESSSVSEVLQRLPQIHSLRKLQVSLSRDEPVWHALSALIETKFPCLELLVLTPRAPSGGMGAWAAEWAKIASSFGGGYAEFAKLQERRGIQVMIQK